jgi:transposase InsO family protein
MCAHYGVSRAGYYAWQQREPSVHSEQDRRLLTRIQAVYAASEATYGSPRICRVLRQAGIPVGRKRVARLMREAGLKARAASLGSRKDAKLTVCALNRALARRRPGEGLIFHSDRGIEYAAFEYRTRLAAVGIVQSMNRPGKPTDNAHMESFFHSLKSDVIHGERFDSEAQLRAVIQRYVAYYNRTRIHSALDYRSPVDFERAAA